MTQAEVFQRFDITASYDRSKSSCGFEIRAAGFDKLHTIDDEESAWREWKVYLV